MVQRIATISMWQERVPVSTSQKGYFLLFRSVEKQTCQYVLCVQLVGFDSEISEKLRGFRLASLFYSFSGKNFLLRHVISKEITWQSPSSES